MNFVWNKKKAAHGGCQTWGGCKRCSFTFTKFLSSAKISSLMENIEYHLFV